MNVYLLPRLRFAWHRERSCALPGSMARPPRPQRECSHNADQRGTHRQRCDASKPRGHRLKIARRESILRYLGFRPLGDRGMAGASRGPRDSDGRTVELRCEMGANRNRRKGRRGLGNFRARAARPWCARLLSRTGTRGGGHVRSHVTDRGRGQRIRSRSNRRPESSNLGLGYGGSCPRPTFWGLGPDEHGA